MEPFSIVRINGKQYFAKKGDRVIVDRLAKKEGSAITFSEVLLLSDAKKVSVGTPILKSAKIEAKIIKHARGPKGMALRYKPKKRVRVHRGYRAELTEIEITRIK